jgi:hypothetical protein
VGERRGRKEGPREERRKEGRKATAWGGGGARRLHERLDIWYVSRYVGMLRGE